MGNISVQRGGTGGASKALSNLANTALNADIIPATDNTRALGSAAKQYKDVCTKKVTYGAHSIIDDVEDNDGVKIVQCFHCEQAGDGTAGNLCLHVGTEPPESVAAVDGHRLWVDASGVLRHQKPASGGSVNLDAGGATAVREQVNTLLNAFRLDLAKFNLMDGMTDAFVSEAGIDTGASTNESYDAGNDLYEPTTTDVITEQQTINNSGGALGDSADIEFWPAQSFQVDSTMIIVRVDEFFNTSVGSPTGNVTLRIETDNSGSPSGTLAHANATKTLSITDNTWNQFIFDNSFSLTGSTTYWLVYSVEDQNTGVNFQMAVNSGNSYADGVAKFSNDGGSSWIVWDGGVNDLAFKLYTFAFDNMILISNSTEAEAEPTDARIVILMDPVDAVTINTDIKAYVSLDNGVNYEQVTLTDEGSFDANIDILTGTEPLTNRTDQTMRYKIESLNNKNLKVHGVGMLWS